MSVVFLIFDDNDVFVSMLVCLLVWCGFCVVVVYIGEEVLDVVCCECFDYVIIDFQLEKDFGL